MTPHGHELPEFLRDALDAETELDSSTLEALGALPQLLAPVPVRASGSLLAAVEVLPLRYAPFFTRLGALWDLPESEVEATLARAALPSEWRKPGLPGLRVVDITGGPRLKNARVTLAHFSAGMRFPAHRHLGPEALLVLEGSYRDQSGRLVEPGDLHEMSADSQHFFQVTRGGPCVAASVQFGMEFTGALMRVLTRLFG